MAAAKKQTAKKQSAQKQTAKKQTAKKQSAKKQTAKKQAAQKPPEQGTTELVGRARDLLRELTGKSPETVSGMDRSEQGWRFKLEVLELARIPNTTDVLGTYELDLTEDGELVGYRRTNRYFRSQAD